MYWNFSPGKSLPCNIYNFEREARNEEQDAFWSQTTFAAPLPAPQFTNPA